MGMGGASKWSLSQMEFSPKSAAKCGGSQKAIPEVLVSLK